MARKNGDTYGWERILRSGREWTLGSDRQNSGGVARSRYPGKYLDRILAVRFPAEQLGAAFLGNIQMKEAHQNDLKKAQL